MKFLPFDEARLFVHKLGLNSFKEWREYSSSNKKPDNIPASPELVYKEYWQGWADWLGNGKKVTYKGEYLSFAKARKLAQSLNLKSQKEWHDYCKSGNRPSNIPANPYEHYKSSWQGWGDWLGTGSVANQDRVYYSFTEARKLVHALELKSRAEWRKYVKSGNKPERLPSNPARTYNQYWKGFGDWLGTGAIAVFKRQFRSFEDAREFARSLNLRGQKQWTDYCKLKKLPLDILNSPT